MQSTKEQKKASRQKKTIFFMTFSEAMSTVSSKIADEVLTGYSKRLG